MSSNLSIRQAVGLAMGTAGAAAASLGYMPLAHAADATGPGAAAGPDASLEEVVVTGSRIRRVDAETANAVFVLDQKTIQDSGYQTVGELLQRIPSVAGNSTNPNLNNGGGFGSSTVELRGLDARRTLVLVDGRRQGIVGDPSVSATDVNQIPLNLIDHVEVLKEGAGAIYGSDAVGGVVNFITRKDVDGLEFGADYGRTSKNDGAQHGFNLIFGKSTENFHFEAGGDYNQQKAVYAGARDYSKYALYLYGGASGVVKSGSSRSPTGRISLPGTVPPAAPGLKSTVLPGSLLDQFGCGPSGSVTRIGPANGMGGAAGTSLSDYRCFTGADHYNYQPYNLLTTPIERTQAFTKMSYDINEYATAYGNFTFNHTHSGSEQAALPFDSPVDDVVVSKNNIYNPFGIDFGGLGTGNEAALWRLTGLSDRVFIVDTNTAVVNMGVKGKTNLSDWTYDLNVGYSRLDYTQTKNGYYLKGSLQNAVGPSFIDPKTGTPTCGTVAAPIPNCTPLNIFNIFAPGQQAILNSTAASVVDLDAYTYKSVEADFNGTVVPLPAGDMKAAVGFAYHGNEGDFTPSPLAVASPPLYLQCLVSNEACSGSSAGHYNSKEEYLELFVPILKDLPGVHSLNLDGGVRHSNYSLFGSTTKSEFKIEYRPIKDVLIRATWAQVFRVPTINDLYAAPVNSSITFNDPCNGLTSAALGANPNLALACKGVVPNTNFKEPNGQITGLNLGNPSLKPENGTVKTVGVVFDPSFLPGFSIDIDYWQYNLNQLITQLDSNYSIQQCVATGNPTFCNLVTRLTSGAQQGQVLVFNNPTFNLGSLMTDGVDLGIKYAMRNTPVGTFQFSADITDTMSYLNIPAPGAAPQQIAGTYNKQFGNYAKYRGLATAAWANWGAEALISARYIHHLNITDPSVSGLTATGGTFPPYSIGSVMYWDASVGYTFVTKTKLLFSMQNIFDKQPPIFYQNNVTNANTDVSTYDTLGRRWLVSFSQKF
ncbi:MAG: TonB-dependent receptor [Gammaproteobacteria bacterium]|nr:TonB-dependent receptor [Gammaproteobacteria bacterium]